MLLLRGELEESKKDLNIILAYLAKKKARGQENESRKINLHSSKPSGNL